MSLINESVPSPPSPERPPLAPYDPPAPAPQADAWRRALRVVTGELVQHRTAGAAKTRIGRSWTQKDRPKDRS